MQNNDLLDLIDEEEFDVQKTILRKKEKRKHQFYIEYDRLTNSIIKISPNVIYPSDIRKDILIKEEDKLITDIFLRRVPVNRLRIKYNRKSNQKILYLQNNFIKNEFNYVLNNSNAHEFIYLHCDLTGKKININFISDNFKNLYSDDILSEQNLAETPQYLNLFCINKFEKSYLYDRLKINMEDLFRDMELSYRCNWLPDSEKEFKNLGFLHYNYDFNISAGTDPLLVPIEKYDHKPNIIYKQEQDKIIIQSMIVNINNFRLDNTIKFYFFDYYDPTTVLGSLELDSTILNNYGQYQYNLFDSRLVKILSNYSHLHIEKIYDNSYYKF